MTRDFTLGIAILIMYSPLVRVYHRPNLFLCSINHNTYWMRNTDKEEALIPQESPVINFLLEAFVLLSVYKLLLKKPF